MTAIRLSPGPEPKTSAEAAALATDFHRATTALARAERERDEAFAKRDSLEAARRSLEDEIQELRAALTPRTIPAGCALVVQGFGCIDMRTGRDRFADPGTVLCPPQTSFDRVDEESGGRAVSVSRLAFDNAVSAGLAVTK